MGYRTILVELADDSGLEPRLQLARTLAGRFDAALIGMHVMPPPFIRALMAKPRPISDPT